MTWISKRPQPRYVSLLGPMPWTKPRRVYSPPLRPARRQVQISWGERVATALVILLLIATFLLSVAVTAATVFVTIHVVSELIRRVNF